MFKTFIKRIAAAENREDAVNNIFYGDTGIDKAYQDGKISFKDHQLLLAIIEKMASGEKKEEKKTAKKRTITACGKASRISFSLSNFASDTTDFIKIINDAPLDAEEIAAALNRSPITYGRYEAYEQTEDQAVILNTDYCGNKKLIYITDKEA